MEGLMMRFLNKNNKHAKKKDNKKLKGYLFWLLYLLAPPVLLWLLLQPETFWERLAWSIETLIIYIYYRKA